MERIAGLAPKRGPPAERIDIIHFDLASSIADIPPGIPGTEVLIIFWRGDIAAGHAYVLRGRTGHVPSVGLMRSVAPARTEAASTGQSELAQKTLTVIICTRDRPDALWRCLQSLSQQNRPPEQILVVDNASRDDAAEDIARAFGAGYTREDRSGLDYARNHGVRKAAGEIVAFVDDDVVVHPAWAEQTIAAFDDQSVMAVTGLVLPAELETHAQVVFETQWGFGRGYQPIDYRPDFLTAFGGHIPPTWKIGAGANMAFRREVFDRTGYFDERLDVGAAGCGGDYEFWYRILAGGFSCRYEPSCVAFHYHRRSERELAGQIRAYMRGHVVTLLVQSRRYRDLRNLRRVFVTLPVWYGRKLFARLRGGKSEANAFLGQEIAGALAGISYYLLRLRSTEAFPRRPPSFATIDGSFLKGLLARAVQAWRPFESRAQKIFVPAATKLPRTLPVTLAKGWAVPRAQGLVKWLRGLHTNLLFIRPIPHLERVEAVKLQRLAAGILDRLRDLRIPDLRIPGRALQAAAKMRPLWAKAGWFYSGKDQLKLVWASMRGHRGAAPVLVFLGFGAAIAEALAISLVIRFLYAVIGGSVDIPEGMLAHIFRFAQSLSGGDSRVLAALVLLFVTAKALLDISYWLLTARVKTVVSEGARNAAYKTYRTIPSGYLRSKGQDGLLIALATQSAGAAAAVQTFARLAANLCVLLVFSVFLIAIAWPVFLAAIAGAGLLRLGSARLRQLFARADWIDNAAGPPKQLGYFLLLGVIAGIAMGFDISAAATLCALGLLYRLPSHLRTCEADLIKLANMAPTLAAWRRSLHAAGGRTYPAPEQSVEVSPDSILAGRERRRAPDTATAAPGPQT